MMQIIPPKISEIKKMPTYRELNVHESVYKAHATLMLIMDMVNRGDSKESIWNVYDEIYNGTNNDTIRPEIVITGCDTASS